MSGWATINFNELQSENSTFMTGPLSLEEASLVVSILNVGGFVGNFAILPVTHSIGAKRTVHALGIPLIVSQLKNKHSKSFFTVHLFLLSDQCITHNLCAKCVLFICIKILEWICHWCISDWHSNVNKRYIPR